MDAGRRDDEATSGRSGLVEGAACVAAGLRRATSSRIRGPRTPQRVAPSALRRFRLRFGGRSYFGAKVLSLESTELARIGRRDTRATSPRLASAVGS
jgi:hypothetical protein